MTSRSDLPELIAEVRALDAAATPGPWELDYENERGPEYIAGPMSCSASWHDDVGQARGEADANLVARYRTLAPQLADECERLRAEYGSEYGNAADELDEAANHFERMSRMPKSSIDRFTYAIESLRIRARTLRAALGKVE